MNTVIRRIGNSRGVVIPAHVLHTAGLTDGDKVVIVPGEGKITLVVERQDEDLTAEQIRLGREFMERYAPALAILAKS